MLRKICYIILLYPVAYGTWAVEKINVVGLFKDKAIVQLDGKQRILTPDRPSPEGVRLISANSDEAVLEINGVRNTYTLGTHIGGHYSGPAGQKTVTIAPDNQGMYWVGGSINDFQVNFIVDTGATVISMNKHQARRIGLDYKMKGKQSMSSTASGLARIYLVKLQKVTVGDIQLRDVEGAVHDGDFPKVILLGNSFLNKVHMKREGQLLQLQK